MHSSILLPCFFPTNTIIIDDNRSFLDGLNLSLDENLPAHYCNSPLEASKLLDVNTNILPIQLSTESTDQTEIQYDFNCLYTAQRFNEISVVVVDYAMPGTNGIEFCKKTQELPVKKIMLTGEASETLAVEAFNRKLIDKFIRKDGKQLIETLENSIKELQKQFFRDKQETIIGALHQHSEKYKSLHDGQFTQFFQALCAQHKIIEYYLTNTPGTYLLLNKKGETKWLVVNSQQAMQYYYESAKNDGATKTILAELQNKTKLPFFGSADAFWEIQATKWDQYMYPAHALQENPHYYYALIDNPNNEEYVPDKILSFDAYLNARFSAKA